MADDIRVQVVNKLGQKVGYTLDPDGDLYAHLKKQVRADELESIEVEETKPAPKSAEK